MRKAFQDIERSLPFTLLAINSDSGSEFLNKPMLEFTKHGTRVAFTRSRPYKKNDNCFVEQKNFTHVRELFGYERFEDPKLVELMNDIYINYWNPLQNFFIPNYKLKEKTRMAPFPPIDSRESFSRCPRRSKKPAGIFLFFADEDHRGKLDPSIEILKSRNIRPQVCRKMIDELLNKLYLKG